MSRINEAKGFLRDVKSGSIFPVFERETIKNVELENRDLRKIGREWQIKYEVVTKVDYLEANMPEVVKIQELPEVKKVVPEIKKEVKKVKPVVRKTTKKRK